jgi:hypothetical protein
MPTSCAEPDMFQRVSANESLTWDGLCCEDEPTNTSVCCMASFEITKKGKESGFEYEEEEANKSNALKLVHNFFSALFNKLF